MRFFTNIQRRYRVWFFLVLIIISLSAGISSYGKWLRINPPPDVDKAAHGHNNTFTCWLATAANMLAGAGYGTGSTVQARADNIYSQLVTQFTTKASGWTDVAVSWWLQSSNNLWKGLNDYTDVTVEGNKNNLFWLYDSNDGTLVSGDTGAMFMANELRRGQLLGISISWPAGNGFGGHAITGWGDSNDANTLTSNPADVIVTDSDYDLGGDTQKYTYSTPFNGWRFKHANGSLVFIKHIITLCPCNPTNVTTKKVVHSFKECNNTRLGSSVTGIAYTVSSDVNILCYKADVNWTSQNVPVVTDNRPDPNSNPTQFTFTWNVSDNPIPNGSCVYSTNKLTVEYDPNSGTEPKISHTGDILTYASMPQEFFPGFDYYISSSFISPVIRTDANDPNITGGYVIGTFSVYNGPAGMESEKVREFRFCYEYKWFHNPENHLFTLIPTQEPSNPSWIGNFKFGHSYGLLQGAKLWGYEDWKMQEPGLQEFNPMMPPIMIPVNLPGLLPYPRGENYNPPETPQHCGDPGMEYMQGDLNRDCYVDFKDFALMASEWLSCNDPNNSLCN
jgi:hypothetical protein